MNSDLSQKTCIPCQGGVPPLPLDEKRKLLGSLNNEWSLIENNIKLRREFKFKNFKKALAFTNLVGEIAEEQMHHPDIELGWGYLNIVIQTHKINDLVESDFIFAAKVDELFKLN